MTPPHFLIIGAMKAGTTSLYFDLMTQPGVWFPPTDKEPGCLASDRVLTPEGRRTYRRYYAEAPPGVLCGDASTIYAKLPDVPGVPARAHTVLGADLRVIYLVREPLSRIVSQHYHEYTAGEVGPDIGEAVREHPRFIAYSSYATQIEPWLDRFGADRVRVVRFESYIADRAGEAAELAGWLGAEARPDLVEAGRVFNQSDGKAVVRGGWRRLAESAAYRRVIRPLMGPALRDRLRGVLLPKAPPKPAGPEPDVAAFVLDRVEPEADRLQRMLGLADPLWDFAAVRARYQGEAAAPPPTTP